MIKLLASITAVLGRKEEPVAGADVPDVLETMNSLSNQTGLPAAYVFTEKDLRNFEITLALYATHQLLAAAIPPSAPAGVAQVVRVAEGLLDQGLVALQHSDPVAVATESAPLPALESGLGG